MDILYTGLSLVVGVITLVLVTNIIGSVTFTGLESVVVGFVGAVFSIRLLMLAAQG